MMNWIIINPLTVWVIKLIHSKYTEFIHHRKHIKIGYSSYTKNCTFGFYATIENYVSVHQSNLNDFTYIAGKTKILNAEIGKFCSIGPNCTIGLGKHPTRDFVSTHPIFFSSMKQSQITFADKNYFEEHESITIGNDVWIGANVIIVGNISIGDGAIAAAGSVITKDIPPYAIVGGVPAKLIRYRFEPDQITKLLELQWWNMDIDYLKNNYKKFHNINDFLDSIVETKQSEL